MSERDDDDDRPRRRRRFEEEDDDDDRPRRRRQQSSGMGVGAILAIVFGVLFLMCAGGGVAVYLLVKPAMNKAMAKAQEVGEHVHIANNLKQIGMALHSYHDKHGRLPPPYFKTKDGKPGLSWRVAILPYLEQETLYRRFKLDEPWDSPTNLPLQAEMPMQFRRDPKFATATYTPFLALVGKNAMFEPEGRITLGDVPDGLANTLMVIEVADAVPWTKPVDFAFDMDKPLPQLFIPAKQMVIVLFADGSVKSLKLSQPLGTWKNLMNRRDGNVVNIDE